VFDLVTISMPLPALFCAGIGLAVVEELSLKGARVTFAIRNQKKAERVAGEIRSRCCKQRAWHPYPSAARSMRSKEVVACAANLAQHGPTPSHRRVPHANLIIPPQVPVIVSGDF